MEMSNLNAKLMEVAMRGKRCWVAGYIANGFVDVEAGVHFCERLFDCGRLAMGLEWRHLWGGMLL
jgi:hypothetical protein